LCEIFPNAGVSNTHGFFFDVARACSAHLLLFVRYSEAMRQWTNITVIKKQSYKRRFMIKKIGIHVMLIFLVSVGQTAKEVEQSRHYVGVQVSFFMMNSYHFSL
jgi:hypothetical protein